MMATPDTWNPDQYDKFRMEREQPFFDLLALVQPEPSMRVVDLGCGTGQLTRVLHARLGARETTGIDRSERMLQAARDGSLPAGLRFESGTIEAFSDDAQTRSDDGETRPAFDLIFSNAALHWVDDRSTLMAGLTRRLRHGGQLAFQVPAMHDDPSQTVAGEIADREPFRAALGGWRRISLVLPPEDYHHVLTRSGFAEQIVRPIEYPHTLESPADVVEWTKGSLLTEYERRLPAALFGQFVDQYRERLVAVLPDARPFIFRFRRILCWARRGPDAAR